MMYSTSDERFEPSTDRDEAKDSSIDARGAGRGQKRLRQNVRVDLRGGDINSHGAEHSNAVLALGAEVEADRLIGMDEGLDDLSPLAKCLLGFTAKEPGNSGAERWLARCVGDDGVGGGVDTAYEA